MLAHLVTACGVLALLTVVPGPDMALVTRRALSGGRRDAVHAAGGIATGLLVWGCVTALGLAALLAASPPAYAALQVVGGGYLIFLGAQSLRSAGSPIDGPSTAEPRRAFLTGLTTNLLNPKIAIFYAALLPALAPPSLPAVLGVAILAVLHSAMTFGWFSAYGAALDRFRPFFSRPSVRRSLDCAAGVVFVGFGLSLAASVVTPLM